MIDFFEDSNLNALEEISIVFKRRLFFFNARACENGKFVEIKLVLHFFMSVHAAVRLKAGKS